MQVEAGHVLPVPLHAGQPAAVAHVARLGKQAAALREHNAVQVHVHVYAVHIGNEFNIRAIGIHAEGVATHRDIHAVGNYAALDAGVPELVLVQLREVCVGLEPDVQVAGRRDTAVVRQEAHQLAKFGIRHSAYLEMRVFAQEVGDLAVGIHAEARDACQKPVHYRIHAALAVHRGIRIQDERGAHVHREIVHPGAGDGDRSLGFGVPALPQQAVHVRLQVEVGVGADGTRLALEPGAEQFGLDVPEGQAVFHLDVPLDGERLHAELSVNALPLRSEDYHRLFHVHLGKLYPRQAEGGCVLALGKPYHLPVGSAVRICVREGPEAAQAHPSGIQMALPELPGGH